MGRCIPYQTVVFVKKIFGLFFKKGVVSTEGSCRKFEYDPCKRVPVKPKALDFSKYDEQDYSL